MVKKKSDLDLLTHSADKQKQTKLNALSNASGYTDGMG